MNNLLDNIKCFWASAEAVYKLKDYTSATILYFKCLFALLDILLLKSLKKTPKDHTERFRMLQEFFPELYLTLDRLFMIYRDTYSLIIEKSKCDEVRKNVIRIAEEQGIEFTDK